MISVNYVIVIYRIYRIHNHQMFYNCSITAGSGLPLDITGLDQIVSDFKSLASTNSATPATFVYNGLQVFTW